MKDYHFSIPYPSKDPGYSSLGKLLRDVPWTLSAIAITEYSCMNSFLD